MVTVSFPRYPALIVVWCAERIILFGDDCDDGNGDICIDVAVAVGRWNWYVIDEDLLASSFVAGPGYYLPTTMDNPMCGESQARQWTKETMMGNQLRDFLQIYFLCGSNGGYGYMSICCCYLN